ncbi:MarR family winged helix-turn-helix transcriptional regulator [Streptomyces sp. NPDC101455]|uniref:MarR family winged helix-turn-helix transcriptional regulator n=1 Tax=Streptomyces sp. NPDC101455 TaxID=3366142 RepID=UPI00382363F9
MSRADSADSTPYDLAGALTLCSTGLSLSRYIVLMQLSEADGDRMRMTELAAATGLSASRVSRVVETLRGEGLVVKRPHATDARGSVAVLTEAGRKRLLGACPAHLSSARRRVLDQLDPALMREPAGELEAVAEGGGATSVYGDAVT